MNSSPTRIKIALSLVARHKRQKILVFHEEPFAKLQLTMFDDCIGLPVSFFLSPDSSIASLISWISPFCTIIRRGQAFPLVNEGFRGDSSSATAFLISLS